MLYAPLYGSDVEKSYHERYSDVCHSEMLIETLSQTICNDVANQIGWHLSETRPISVDQVCNSLLIYCDTSCYIRGLVQYCLPLSVINK